jgi:hypothetical protein
LVARSETFGEAKRARESPLVKRESERLEVIHFSRFSSPSMTLALREKESEKKNSKRKEREFFSNRVGSKPFF